MNELIIYFKYGRTKKKETVINLILDYIDQAMYQAGIKKYLVSIKPEKKNVNKSKRQSK